MEGTETVKGNQHGNQLSILAVFSLHHMDPLMIIYQQYNQYLLSHLLPI